ncbi:hypothetical protein GCM10008959_36650 [Deinococcus seoulensis]|uniref:Uncharacterized protein n=1 Tax=Deinococcus seoulensis TaxID=1837379 RepID=A0ABQ2S032_9DEIO|nr:hypothetical protein GCM10008959_36650 [Deinococcus seoulensis]
MCPDGVEPVRVIVAPRQSNRAEVRQVGAVDGAHFRISRAALLGALAGQRRSLPPDARTIQV